MGVGACAPARCSRGCRIGETGPRASRQDAQPGPGGRERTERMRDTLDRRLTDSTVYDRLLREADAERLEKQRSFAQEREGVRAALAGSARRDAKAREA